MPIIMIVIFALYLIYLAFFKKNLKSQLATVVYPGAFFVLVWGVCYFAFLQ